MARKAKTKKERIIDMLAQGKSVSEIVKVIKVSPSYVYLIKSEAQAKMDKAVGILQMRAETEQALQTGIPTIRAEHKVTASKAAPKLTWWQKVIKWLKGE